MFYWVPVVSFLNLFIREYSFNINIYLLKALIAFYKHAF